MGIDIQFLLQEYASWDMTDVILQQPGFVFTNVKEAEMLNVQIKDGLCSKTSAQFLGLLEINMGCIFKG